MAKIIRTQGSGITQAGIVQFDVGTDLAEIVAAANHSFAMERFSSAQHVLASTARNILAAKGLPVDPRGTYRKIPEGWRQLNDRRSQDGSYESFLNIFLDQGIQPDTSAGYAAQALVLIDQISALIPDHYDEALALAIDLGGLIKEATLKSTGEKDALRGAAIQRAAQARVVFAYRRIGRSIAKAWCLTAGFRVEALPRQIVYA